MNYKLLYKLLKKYIKDHDTNSLVIVNENKEVSQELIYYNLKLYEIENYIYDSKIFDEHQFIITIPDIEKQLLICENKLLKQKMIKLKRENKLLKQKMIKLKCENEHYYNNIINSIKANSLLCKQALKGGK